MNLVSLREELVEVLRVDVDFEELFMRHRMAGGGGRETDFSSGDNLKFAREYT